MRDPGASYAALRDAALAISSDLSLDSVLQKIVDAARELVECRYAALGVLREHGPGLSDFVVSGMSAEAIRGAGAWPRGLGLLGAVIEDPRPVRVANVLDDRRAVGLPPGHPPMKSLLAVPIRGRERVLGNFYLADRLGEDEFDADDEEMLVALAAHAAIAIENATLYSHTDRKLRRVVEAVGRAEERARFLVELSGLLHTGPTLDEPPLVAALERLTALLGDACVLCVVDARGGVARELVVHRDPARKRAAARFVADAWRVLREEVLDGGRALLVEDVRREGDGAGGHALDPALLERLRFTTAIALAVRAGGRVHGVFLTLGSTPLRLTPDDLGFAQVVAERLGTAIENARLSRELAEAMHAREEFVAIATHELRSPVTAILVNADLARRSRESAPERVRDALDVIARQAKRLAALTDELLDASRIRSGRMTLHRARHELCALVRAAVERHRAELEPPDRARLTLEVPEGPIFGDWDEGRVEQILQNLMTNALKFSPNGGAVRVSVAATPDAASIVVRDHGLGIAPADLPHIFEPFYRATSATERRIRGSGLGLHICKAIAEQHGGSLTCESVEHESSTFTLTLPRAAEGAGEG